MSEDETVARPAPPEIVVEHPAWLEAISRVRAELSEPGAVVAILGPAGTGKTMMLRTLSRDMRERGRVPLLLERGDAEATPGERPDLVLIDEADRIGLEMMQSLLASGIRNVVLAALPSFAERLDAVPNAIIVPLRPLRADEAMTFLRARAETLSQPGWLGDGPASEIVANSRGIPRLLTAMLSATSFVAALYQAPHASVEHVREAVSLRGDVEGTGASAGAAGPDLPSDLDAPPDEEIASETPDPQEHLDEPEDSAPMTAAPAERRSRPWLVMAGAAVAVLLIGAYLAVHPGRDAAKHGGAPTMLAQAPQAKAPDQQPPSAPPPVPTPAQPVPAEPQVAQASPPPPQAKPLSASPAPEPTTPAASPTAPVQTASTAASNSPTDAAEPTPASPSAPAGSVMPHVVLSYPEGDTDAERRSLDAVRTLRAAGFAASDPVPLPRRVSDPGIAYFFAEDQAGASSVSRALGGAFGESHAAPLPSSASLPRPGTIEIQVGSAPPAPSHP